MRRSDDLRGEIENRTENTADGSEPIGERTVVRVATLLKDGTRMFRRLLTDPRVPHPVKLLLAVAVLPIPGPFEEAAGALALWWLSRRSPTLLGEHWRALREESSPTVAARSVAGASAPSSTLGD